MIEKYLIKIWRRKRTIRKVELMLELMRL